MTDETKPKAAEAFAGIYNNYVQSMRDNWFAAQAKCGDQHRNYVQDVQQLHLQLQKEAQNARQMYAKVCQGIAEKNENAFQAHTDASTFYAQAMTVTRTTADNQWAELQEKHKSTFAANKEEFDKQNEVAYRALLKDLQATWAELDTDTVDANDMRQFAQALLPLLNYRG